ncbi:MAG: HAD family phosphatase [Pseudomonadota bacterium]
MNTIIFDLGGVLLNWQPHRVWSPELGETEARAFMERVNFPSLNLRADGGESFADLAKEIPDPADAERFLAYPLMFGRAVEGGIAGMWELLDTLVAQGTPLHAITNFPAECWTAAVTAHPQLGTSFGEIFVSGREGIMKPDALAFQRLLDRAGVTASDCLFIDDSAKNIEAAASLGLATHHFQGAEPLRADLVARGLL